MCREAVVALLAEWPDLVVVVGDGDRTIDVGQEAGGTLRDYGLDVTAGGTELLLPLSLTVGAWLLDEDGHPVPRRYVGIEATQSSTACRELGVRLTSLADRVGLLVMGDGSARRTSASPGPYDVAAIPFDDAVQAALAAGDLAALDDLDPTEARRLWVAGRAAWQVLAGAASTAGRIEASLLASAAPYGVGYFVATWRTPTH